MKPNHEARAFRRFIVALGVSAITAFACSNDNAGPTKEPPPIGGGGDAAAPPGTGGKAGASGTGAAPTTDAGTGGTAAGGGSGTLDGGGGVGGDSAVPSSGGQAGKGGTGGDGTGGAPSCDPKKTGSHPKACFPCDPTKTEEFLNHCTTSDCQPFDNPGRLGAANWNDGKLLPLP